MVEWVYRKSLDLWYIAEREDRCKVYPEMGQERAGGSTLGRSYQSHH